MWIAKVGVCRDGRHGSRGRNVRTWRKLAAASDEYETTRGTGALSTIIEVGQGRRASGQLRARRRSLLGQEGRGVRRRWNDRPATETTTAETAAETTAPDETGAATTAPSDDTTETTAAEEGDAEFTPETLPPPEGEPVEGGRLVVAGEAEVGAPWTPANVQCDSYCQMRIRTFFEPLVVTDNNLDFKPYLAETVEPNDDFTVWTIKLREGINFTDGTPLNADAAIDNINRSFFGLIPRGALKDVAKNTDGTILTEKLDDYTFTIATGKNGNPAEPVPWPLFPYLLTAQPGMMASPAWLAAVDGDESLATQPVGTGPFIVQEYLPGDRMTVTKNPDYWRQDAEGRQLPVPRRGRVPRDPGLAGAPASPRIRRRRHDRHLRPDSRRTVVGQHGLRFSAPERARRDGLRDAAPHQAAVPEPRGPVPR